MLNTSTLFETDKGSEWASSSPSGPLRSLLPICLIIAVDTVGFGILLPMLPFYTEQYGASALIVGSLISVYALCSFVASPLLGHLSDRYGRRPILLFSQVGSLAGYILFALSHTLWLLFVARIIDGLTAGNMSVAQAYVSDNTAPADRTRAFGITGAAFGVGLLLGPALGGLLAVKNIHAPIWLAAALSGVSFSCTLLLLPKGRPSTAPSGPRQIIPAQAMIATFKSPDTGVLARMMASLYFSLATYTSGLALFLAGRFRWNGHLFNATNVGLVFTFGALLNILVQATVMKRLTSILEEKRILTAGFLLMVVGYSGMGLCRSVATLIGFVALANVGSAILRPVLVSQLSKRVEARRQGLVMGVNQAIFSLSAVVAPLMSGGLINRGWYTAWALAAATVVLIGFFLSFALKSVRDSVTPLR